jgi:Coenzyme PQQ synthesis protein D (PqqD)
VGDEVEEVLRLRSQDLEWREIEGEVVVLDLRTSTYMAVNNTGYVLWKALAAGAVRSQLVTELTERFELARETAERDVDDFVDSLKRADILG